jgi:hypothetical protein
MTEPQPESDWEAALGALERFATALTTAAARVEPATRRQRERLKVEINRWQKAIEPAVATVQGALAAASIELRPLIEAAQRYYNRLDRIAQDLDKLTAIAERGWALSVFGLLMAPEAYERAAGENLASRKTAWWSLPRSTAREPNGSRAVRPLRAA